MIYLITYLLLYKKRLILRNMTSIRINYLDKNVSTFSYSQTKVRTLFFSLIPQSASVIIQGRKKYFQSWSEISCTPSNVALEFFGEISSSGSEISSFAFFTTTSGCSSDVERDSSCFLANSFLFLSC